MEHKKTDNSIYRCPKCKVAFVHPQPSVDELNTYYTGMYQEKAISFNEVQMSRASKSIKGYLKRLKWNGEKSKGKTFLDLGGGLGYYSKAASEYGMSPILVEKDSVSVDFAKNKLNLKSIIKKDLNEFFSSNTEKYDVVFFRHVIEHVTEPNEVIESISSILKDDGIFIIETDNNAGIEILFKKGVKDFYLKLYTENFKNVSFSKLLSVRPFALDPPRHLFAFRMGNLSNLLEKNGIKLFIKDHYRLGHPVYWPNIHSPKIMYAIKAFSKFKLRTGIKLILEYFNLLYRILLQFLGLSSGICIYGKK
ncbi:class I SAM-dependent methyltransferase [Winogradskyella sp. DF17]|uniref:Class I SAM-dependent methyltransferase n=1 Tax=Winogradskyella pelagia TaxID=2819984 RepID=A0ABS3T1R7_9FLAO|nr:class I SAM-dependent methyltransferase [Winogradskyella sp. DF17]MBO3116693.1 class I SAM-dependent methyltransferase [Winogradskyella sp. DF17]